MDNLIPYTPGHFPIHPGAPLYPPAEAATISPNQLNPRRRKSARLQHYDYAETGGYFVTICAYQRESLFGEVQDGLMVLNDAGLAVRSEWLRTPEIRREASLDAFQVMPNHLHLIVFIHRGLPQDRHGAQDTDAMRNAGAQGLAPLHRPNRPPQSLGALMAGFKAAATKRINQLRQTPGAPVWQRNYYERVLRNERELEAAREYIIGNPSKWDEDANNPRNW